MRQPDVRRSSRRQSAFRSGVAAVALCLSACGSASPPPPDDDVTEEWTSGDDAALEED